METFVSVVCDLVYLSRYGNSDSLPSEQQQQTQALFILNIIFSAGTILTDLLVLCVRRGVLTELKEEPSSSPSPSPSSGADADANPDANADAETSSADAAESNSGSGSGSGDGPQNDTLELEMGDMYRNSDDGIFALDTIPTTSNPMHVAAQEELRAKDMRIKQLEEMIAGARQPPVQEV